MRLPLILVLLMTSGAQAAEVTRFAPSWEEGWVNAESDGVCTLSVRIPNYGEARFVASPSAPTEFEFQARRDLQASDIDIARLAPDWHPKHPMREHLGVARHIPTGGGVARGRLADAMMMALRDGFVLEMRAAASFRDEGDLSWQLPSMHFLTAYDEFSTCAHTSLRVAWAQISRTRVSFEVGSAELDPMGRARLDAIVQFVQSDPEVTALYIDGHTDSTGDRRTNHKLSEQRARAVEDYLKSKGMKQRQFVVRFHGAAYPVADNDSAAGKAMNRRATVRLSRDETAKVAQK